MNKLLLYLFLLLPTLAFAQGPIIRNVVTTQALSSVSGFLTNNGSGVLGFTRNGSLFTNLQPASANLTNWSGLTTNQFVTRTNGSATGLTLHGVSTNIGDMFLPGTSTFIGGSGFARGLFRTNGVAIAVFDTDQYEYANTMLVYDVLNDVWIVDAPVTFNDWVNSFNVRSSIAITNISTGDITTITASNSITTAASAGREALLSSSGTFWSSNQFQIDTVAADNAFRVSTNGRFYGTMSPSAMSIITNTILSFTLDGAGSAITTGAKNGFPVSGANYTIVGWSITAQGTSPTCTLDLWRIAQGTALPTVANTIMGTKPALASGNAVKSETLTSWSTSVTNGDIWGINVDACSAASNIVFQVYGVPR